MENVPVHEIPIPEYNVKDRPDHAAVGAKIDDVLKHHFLGQHVAVRCIGSQEHPDKTADELIAIIKTIGHDRYEPDRKGDRYENVENKHIDFFALDFVIEPEGRYLEQFIEPFYEWPKRAGREPVRLDIVLVYDFSALEVVEHRYEGRESEVKRDGFVFRNHDKKTEALKTIIKIL
ncbi:MAG: hypothetical protein PHT12_03100 [Patescibacteria group bacterium]|nr:hypothetical protein [Patescibacteria group bacterium]